MQAVAHSAIDNLVYVGGHFDASFTSSAPTVTRHQLAASDPTAGAVDPAFAPAMTKATPGVYAIVPAPALLLTGGGFTGTTATPQPHYAQFALQ